MNLSDIIKNVNSFIGDYSTDRITADERYQALTEATAWLLEELGNEHMTDKVTFDYIPSVTWYKMDNLSPYMLTSGQVRYTYEQPDRIDFTRVESRDMATMPHNRHAYSIDRYNGDTYLGIIIPREKEREIRDVVPFNLGDGYTYPAPSFVNLDQVRSTLEYVEFSMEDDGFPNTMLTVQINPVNLDDLWDEGYAVVDLYIPDATDITSLTLRLGQGITSNYYIGSTFQDVNGNNISQGMNTFKFRLRDFTDVGTPTKTGITHVALSINHSTLKPRTGPFRISDLRVSLPIQLSYKYLFYRVGKDSSGNDLIEFSADTDVPFFIERYPQYRFAVAHKAAAALHRSMQAYDSASSEERLANNSLDRFRKNFSGERDMPSSAFKPAGISFTKRRIRRR